jgi:magnesium transporter
MSVKEIKHGDLTWIHISKVNDESIEYLKKNFKFHALDIEDIKTAHHSPKLDVYKNYLFLITQVPHIKTSKKIVPHEISIFAGDGYLITIQDSKDREIKNLFYRCLNNRKMRTEWLGQNSGFLLYQILEEIFVEVQSTLNQIGVELNEIENEVYKEELQTVNEIRQLAQHRRNIFAVRRVLDPQRFIISTLSHTRRTFLDESLSIYFDDIRDLLDRLWVIVESYNETSDGLHWTIESLVNQRTTKIISALTIVSVAFTPLIVVTGFYGMNVGALPLQNNPLAVQGILVALTLGILLVVFIFRKKRLL